MMNTTTALIAMGAPPAQGQEAPPFYITMAPFILMLVVFYFILIRPQQKKAKQHQELLKGLRSGDKVLTSAGILGTVISVKEKSVTLRSADTKIEILKSAVAEITERGNEVKEA
ncbi:MAG: preprotein translocase subunit YajC [Verrucomicrobia bacterium]|nr:preprotein translocase subunit YajC [Verrucomicrobiota bacterium]